MSERGWIRRLEAFQLSRTISFCFWKVSRRLHIAFSERMCFVSCLQLSLRSAFALLCAVLCTLLGLLFPCSC